MLSFKYCLAIAFQVKAETIQLVSKTNGVVFLPDMMDEQNRKAYFYIPPGYVDFTLEADPIDQEPPPDVQPASVRAVAKADPRHLQPASKCAAPSRSPRKASRTPVS